MSEADVIARIEGGIGRLSLNRPRALNALTAEMCAAISDALLAWIDDDAVQMVLIDHAGDRGFCAGGDIRLVAQSSAGDGREARRFFTTEYRMNELLFRYPKPVVVIMDGITMGGGVGISMPARFRIATERTVWAMPEGDIGLFPDVGAGWSLPRLPGHAGAWLALTGARLKAADCCALGVATHFVESGRLAELKSLLTSAHSRESGNPGFLAEGSTRMEIQEKHLDPRFRGDERNIETIMDEFVADPGPSPLARHHPAIERLFAHDTVEEIMTALKADCSEWALAQHAIVAGKCPTTLKVALRLIREGAGRASFTKEMAVEYRVAVHMSRRPDFIEGVRAVILDKDNHPSWSPARLEDVSPSMLDDIFAPLPDAEEWTPLP